MRPTARQNAKRKISTEAAEDEINHMVQPSAAELSTSPPGPAITSTTAAVAAFKQPSAKRPRLTPRPTSGASSFRSTTLFVAGYPLEDAHLHLPPGLSPSETLRRRNELAAELAFQQQNPPVLPASRVAELPPKPQVGEFLKFPEGVSSEVRRSIEEQNNAIAAQHQRIDRERNNMAAKKSRRMRLEALENTRRLLNDKAAECAWFRMRVATLGGSANEWESVPVAVKSAMVEDVAQRVEAVESDNVETKRREEGKKRARKAEGRAGREYGTVGGDAEATTEAGSDSGVGGGQGSGHFGDNNAYFPDTGGL